MYFKIMSKVVKYTCWLRRYNYTHGQLNTIHFNIIFLEISLRGEGAQILSLPPGASYPCYATEYYYFVINVIMYVHTIMNPIKHH